MSPLLAWADFEFPSLHVLHALTVALKSSTGIRSTPFRGGCFPLMEEAVIVPGTSDPKKAQPAALGQLLTDEEGL